MSAPPTTTVSPATSTTLLANPRHSLHDPLSMRPTSIVRPQSPVLGTLPQTTFSPVPAIHEPAGYNVGSGPALGPHAITASGAPVWPGLGALHGQPAMPSPALTEGSSVNVPEGLLDPRLALRLGAQGMQSQGAISFRDDMDYSRPIGGWVNNRQYSRTTIQTVSTRDSPRRPSLESRDTHATGMETIHAHTDAPGVPEDEPPPQS
ncbi:hypothetical protein GY45DRAFT_1262726 [Cubamyces sp. BRFM 1775]|nr:hypothetical protein GY45DRAFT_1262726 [Cubamyces sp. BRFM 1775]